MKMRFRIEELRNARASRFIRCIPSGPSCDRGVAILTEGLWGTTYEMGARKKLHALRGMMSRFARANTSPLWGRPGIRQIDAHEPVSGAWILQLRGNIGCAGRLVSELDDDELAANPEQGNTDLCFKRFNFAAPRPPLCTNVELPMIYNGTAAEERIRTGRNARSKLVDLQREDVSQPMNFPADSGQRVAVCARPW